MCYKTSNTLRATQSSIYTSLSPILSLPLPYYTVHLGPSEENTGHIVIVKYPPLPQIAHLELRCGVFGLRSPWCTDLETLLFGT